MDNWHQQPGAPVGAGAEGSIDKNGETAQA